MRLPAKIFFSVITVFSIVFLVSGYFLLSYSFEICVEREVDFALSRYKYDRFSVQSGLIAYEDTLAQENLVNLRNQEIFREITEDVENPVCFIMPDGARIYDEIKETDRIDMEKLTEDFYWYQVVHKEEDSYILFGSQISQAGLNLNFVTKTDITDVIAQQEILQRYYRGCFCAAIVTAILLTLGLSILLTNPLKRMAKASDQIANGCYHERLQVKSRDELGELANSFNCMTAAVEKAISDLSEEAEKKEDFVANFAHELKTPLTSIIGYADRIYQKDMTKDQAKQAAWYIWNEGMRLEALSLKLMDLTNLNRQKVVCICMSAREVLQDVLEGTEEIWEKQGICTECQAEEAYIKVDYDLIKTALLNLLDNAAKAECSKICIVGKRSGQNYSIIVSDNGNGIPRQEMSRITEAFYMVDKARSRRQHGAGIGLALVKRIAEIHGGELQIQSEEKRGTRVTISLPALEGGDEIE